MAKATVKFVGAIFLLLFSFSLVNADGGMWPLYDLNKLPFDNMKAMGLNLELKEIYNPDGLDISDAVIAIRGGTASFVSENGLLVTNHHIADGFVQKQSTIEQNYLKNGFYAPTKEDEIAAIGCYVRVTLSIENVTDKILGQIDHISEYLEQHKAEQKAINAIIKEAEKDRDVECRVAKMYGGKYYILYTYFKIKDIRLVYVPPQAIGNFGGEIDNWMWPRHTGDFSFLRAYVAPDGSSAQYSEENVPYHPHNFLKISSKPLKENDFTILMGYPGRTSRYLPSAELDHLENEYIPLYIEFSEKSLNILDSIAAADPEIALRLSNKRGGISNFYKKRKGQLLGLKRARVLSLRRHIEDEFTNFLTNNPQLGEKYGHVLPELRQAYIDINRYYIHDFYMRNLSHSSSLLYYANALYKWAVEREKDESDRKRGYLKRDEEYFLKGLKEVQINLIPEFDIAMLKRIIREILTLPEDQTIKAFTSIFADVPVDKLPKKIDEYVENLFEKTTMIDADTRVNMFNMTKAELENLGDPLIYLAISLKPEKDAIENRDDTFKGARNRLMPKLMEAYWEWKKGDIAPDANSTKRFNYGQVEAYSPRDGIQYDIMTTLTGIMEKETGEKPFIVPDKLKATHEAKDFGDYLAPDLNDIPVNFITSNSGTNGSSGSPVINGDGELIGLDFDTSFDGVVADYYFDPDYTRAVVCDSRYMLFIIDKVYHLDELVSELTITK
ncbi:MAG: S46 family peptidase [candidate division Zixibacteria bacterium]